MTPTRPPFVNLLPSPFGVPLERDALPTSEAAAAERADRADAGLEPPPPGETGRELTGDESAAALADVARPLRTDGPTLEEYVAAGYPADKYPPRGYAERGSSIAPPAAAVFGGKKPQPQKTRCPNCKGAGTIAQGQGRTRCPQCSGAGELART